MGKIMSKKEPNVITTTPLVSVVVPIYKVEKYLHQCIDSILRQTLKNIEIILVDDGSPDKCPEICDEYAQKDKRVKVIHKINGGLGSAYNAGLDAASGEYIGFVEPDDFIADNMYELLHSQAIKFDAEMVIGSWYYHKENADVPDIEIKANTSENTLFCITDYPFLLTIHPSLWAKLYKRNSLTGIRFPEFKGAGYCDAPFYTEILCKIKKIIALHEPLYFYRTDNENASSNNAQSGKSLIGIIESWNTAKKILLTNNMYNQLKEELYFHAIKPSFRFFCNINKNYKKEFFNKFKYFVSDLKNDDSFTYKYFSGNLLNEKRKKFIKSALNNDYNGALSLIKYDNVSCVKIFGLPLIKKIEKGSVKKTYFLGIPFIKKTKNKDEEHTKVLNIIKIKKGNFKIKYYLFGIKIFSKIKYSSLQKFLFNKLNSIENSVLNLKTNILASQIHPSIFAKYKNRHKGEDVVIVACGPSVNKYTPIKNAVHIAVNRAFKINTVKFNYLFINDTLYPEGDKDLISYDTNCIKFLGLLPDRFLFNNEVFRHPVNLFNKDNVHPYVLEYKANNIWAYDIAYEPFADYNSTVFSALQFALYTNPKRIYLVGCDCTSGYFYNTNDSNNSSKSTLLINKWKTCKRIKDKFYPDTEIISINPVGLKGFFKDIYTNKETDTKE